MLKKGILAVIAVYLVWTGLDYVIHVVILGQAYMDTAQYWRPEAEMKMGLMQVVSVLYAISFVAIYVRLIGEKSARKGLEYGCWLGFGTGVAMGYGMYSVMPIPYFMAITWFLGSWVECLAAGLVTGLIVCEKKATAEAAPAQA